MAPFIPLAITGLVPVIPIVVVQRFEMAGSSPAMTFRHFLFFACSAMIGLATRKQSTPIGAPQ